MAKTPNAALNLIPFDQDPWDVDMNENASIIDSIIGQYFAVANFVGVWKNGTVYAVGQHVVDAQTGQLFLCNVAHTSIAAPGLFSADRAARPALWTEAGSSASADAAAAAASATAAATSAAQAATAVGSSLGYLGGFGLTSSVSLLGIAAGRCADSTGTTSIELGTWVKSLSGTGIFLAGSGQVGMGVGVATANNTWYHVFAIIVDGVSDVYFDTSVTAANKPVGTTAFRRIGSVKTDGSAHITLFDQLGDRFVWRTPVLEYNAIPGLTTAISLVLQGVPPDIVTEGYFFGTVRDTANPEAIFYLSSSLQEDLVPSRTTGITAITGPSSPSSGAYNVSVLVHANRLIRRRVSNTACSVTILTNGWTDTRGRG